MVPSRWEGFPYAILEAQSCGIPVITTDAPGCKDIISHGENCWISEIDGFNQISENIIEAFNLWKNDFEKFKKMGIFARKNVMRNYEETKIYKKIEKILVGK